MPDTITRSLDKRLEERLQEIGDKAEGVLEHAGRAVKESCWP